MKTSLFAFLVFAPLALAQCPYLDVSLLDSAGAEQGVAALYPITLTNTGLNAQYAKLSVVCPDALFCSFDSSSATLQPSQSQTFNLYVETEGAAAGNYQIPLGIAVGAQTQDCDSRSLALEVTQPGASPAAELPEFSVSFAPVENRSARPGDYLEYEITITNNNPLPARGFARISAAGAFSGSTAFDFVDVNLAGNETKAVRARAFIPAGTPSGTYQTMFNVQAVTNYGIQHNFQLPSQVFVFSGTLNLVLQDYPSECASVKHGETLAVRMKVRNDGEIEGPFRLSIEGGQEFVSVSPELLEVKNGDTQEIAVSLKPTGETLLGRYDYNLALSYGGYTAFQKPLCAFVYSVNDFTVAKSGSFEIKRGEVNALVPFVITNNGTLAENFSIEVRPPATLLVQPEPSSFRLSPGESREAVLVVSTSLQRTPLGNIVVPTVIRTSKVGRLVNFNLTLVPSGKPGESFLNVLTPSLHAVAGKQTQQIVSVANTKTSALHAVKLEITGDAAGWMSVDSAPQDIEAGQTAAYRLAVRVPASEAEKTLSATLVLTSLEGEKLEYPVALYATRPEGSMSVRVSDSQYLESSGELVVTVVVKNTGEGVLDAIQPVQGLTGFAIASTPSAVSLAPGEERSITVTVKNPQGDSIPLALKSSEGIESPVVAVQVKKSSGQPSILLIALLVLIAALLAYSMFGRKGEEEPQHKYLP